MKIKSNILLIIVFAGLLLNFSCKKPTTYSPIPYIQYVSFVKIPDAQGIDQKGVLTFSFTDGDGDIGLGSGDTAAPFNHGSPYYYDLFLTYYEKQNGVYVAVALPMTNNSRIPLITLTGQNKSIKGTIADSLFINNPTSSFDTIAYDVSICDRALHVSNKIRTPDIIVHK